MSFLKYFGEKKDSDGQALWWPGGPDGFPYRGPQPPQTTKAEYNNLKLSGKARCRLFYLAIKEDAIEYVKVRDKCANGLYALLDRDRVWDEDTKNYRIFLEWLELGYDTIPTEGTTDAVRDYTKQATSLPMPYSRLAGLRDNQDRW